MHSEDERDYGLGVDAVVSVCTRNTNIIMVLWLSDELGTRTFVWFGHGCSGYHMRSEHERYYGLGMEALVVGCTRNTNVFMV